MIPGAMLHKRKPWALEPEYGPCFLICALLLSAAAVTAEEDANGIIYYLLLCAVSGLQNGMSSTFSANLIRSSHLSGTTTDIGLIIGQKLRGTHTNTWKLRVLISRRNCRVSCQQVLGIPCYYCQRVCVYRHRYCCMLRYCEAVWDFHTGDTIWYAV